MTTEPQQAETEEKNLRHDPQSPMRAHLIARLRASEMENIPGPLEWRNRERVENYRRRYCAAIAVGRDAKRLRRRSDSDAVPAIDIALRWLVIIGVAGFAISAMILIIYFVELIGSALITLRGTT